jgi:hypothetical protein
MAPVLAYQSRDSEQLGVVEGTARGCGDQQAAHCAGDALESQRGRAQPSGEVVGGAERYGERNAVRVPGLRGCPAQRPG